MNNFAPSLAHLLTTEGGYVNDPKDPGGATNEGVTQKEYDLWRTAQRQTVRSVRLINANEVAAIYRHCYWDTIRADKLPSGVDYCVFDCAVNSGPHQAVKFLQRAAGAIDDGFIGPATITAVNAADPRRIINAVSAERLSFLKRLPTWGHFEDGWTSRVNSVEITARGMSGGS